MVLKISNQICFWFPIFTGLGIFRTGRFDSVFKIMHLIYIAQKKKGDQRKKIVVF